MHIESRDGEAELLRSLREPQSRERAFTVLMRTFQEPLYAHIRRMLGNHDDTDDVLQVTFIKSWKYLDGFRGDSKIKTWLFKIATNEALTHLSKRQNQTQDPLADIANHIEHSHADLEMADDGDTIQLKLEEAVNRLPTKQKQVFVLKYYDELTYEEMADVLGGSVGSLKASYHHAVKKIELFLTTD
jgi:RNA polymerase sigma factor (sigma-70 family)